MSKSAQPPLRAALRVFAAPVFEDEEKTRVAGMLHTILIAVLALLVVLLPVTTVINLAAGRPPSNPLVSLAGIAAMLGLYILMRRGHVRLVSALLSFTLVGLVTFSLFSAGVRHPSVAGYLVAIVTAGLLLGGRGTAAFTALSLAALAGVFFAETNGLLTITSEPPTGATLLVTYAAIFGITALLLRLAAQSIDRSLQHARQNERAHLEANRELQALRVSLEQVVVERTAQLGVSAEVGRAITSVLDQGELIPRVVQLITDRFNFYYAAVFLIDEFGKFAVLREASGAAGQILKESGHKLEIGGQSMVGAAIRHKKPRVSGQTRDEPLRFANPLLPDTQAEITLPLMVGDRVFGALDVQSTQPAAFDGSTVTLLQNLADQIAIALNNAQQYESAQHEARQATALFEASQLAGSLSEDLATAAQQLLSTVAQHADFDAWMAGVFDAEAAAYSLLTAHLGSESASGALAALGSAGRSGHLGRLAEAPTGLAIRMRQPIVINDPDIEPLLSDLLPTERAAYGRWVSVPALLGDRALGAVSLGRAIDKPPISARDVQLAQAIANQLAVAIENRRLFDHAQHAAAELDDLMRRYTHEGWSKFDQTHGGVIQREFSRPGAKPLDAGVLLEIERASRSAPAAPAQEVDGHATIGVPITLRGAVIGTLGVQAEQDRRWSDDELVTLHAVADQVAQSIEAARLLDETEASLQETTELYRAGQAIMAAQSPADILRAFTEHVMPPELGRCALALIDPASPPEDPMVELVAVWESGNEQPATLGSRFTVVDSPGLGTQVFIVPDVAASPVLPGEVKERLRNSGVQAMAVIPLTVVGRLLGWLLVQSMQRAYPFSEREIRVWRTLAGQAAVGLENRRLFEETQRQAELESALNQISQTIRASLDPQVVLDLQTTIDELGRMMRASRSFYVINHDDLSFETAYEWCAPGIPSFKGMSGQWADLPETFRLLKTGQPLLSEIVDRDDPLELRPVMRAHGVLSHAHVPVVMGNRLIGIFGFDQVDRERRWTADEVNLLRRVAEQLATTLENARVYQETQRRVELESALNRIGRSIKASLDPQAVLDLQATIGELGRVMQTSRSFYLANEDDRRFVRGYEWCAPGAPAQAGVGGGWDARSVPQSLRLFKSGQSIVAERVERDDPPELHELMRAQGVLSHMHVPVLTGNRLIGILGFEQIDRERRWTSEEVNIVHRVADQLAAALENARLYQNVRARVNELTALTRIGRRLAATLQLEDVLNAIVEEAITVTPADRGSIALYDPAQDVLELRVLIGYSEESTQRLAEGSARHLRRGDGLHGRLLTTGQAVLSNDVQNDVEQDPDYITVDSDTRSELIVPIKQGDSLLGALNLGSPRADAFGESDQRLIEALADQAAVAIVNARAYEAERAALERMREVDRLKTQFLANMSHELRTPLNSIIGFSRVILRGIDGPLTELQQADLTAIHNSGQHLLGLINDILDLSKIEAGKMELALEDIDLPDTIKGVMSTAIALVKDKPVELRQNVPADLPPIKADPRRIRQVILNLVSNASKFTERGSITVSVVVHPSRRELFVSVSDTGIGVPADKLEHIFEEFTQIDASTTRKVGGTGLGLAISRRFVEMHNGRIWVESQLGVGSIFTFALPLAVPAEPDAERAAPGPEVAPGKKVILCVDDDPGVITLYRRYLDKQGYQVVGLNDASRAVEEARRLQPFAITLDVLMPNRDGWAVLAELKTTPEVSRIPILVCSIVEDESKGFSLGASDYLVKPIVESELLRALDRVGTGKPAQTVLIVDDEPEAIRLVRRILDGRSGFRVLEAQGGAQGIASVQAHRPDLVLLDLMMPDLDGFAVLDTIRGNRLTHSTPVIIVTAKDLTEEDRARLRGKTSALLNKGLFAPEKLLSEIAMALDQLTRKEPSRPAAAAPASAVAERVPGK